jgi:cobalt-zinc-cadmium efflux system protein
MKSERNILVAFVLNFSFAIFEFFGGIFTNSVAIVSDAIHDMGDAISIGISFFLEKISKKKPNNKYTYGYVRYSVIGSLITTVILLAGSIFVIYNAVVRIINPVDINYDGMIIFAIIGTIVNFLAAYFTKEGNSLNQKAVNLHMLEDLLGWIVVLIGAVIMKFTNIKIIDPILSILVALFIFKHAFNNFKLIVDLFLEKTPKNVSLDELKEHILQIKGVENVHHIHVWSIDGYNNFATMHIVSNNKNKKIKEEVKNELKEHGIVHSTIEFESTQEHCLETECVLDTGHNHKCHHHHH